MKLNDFISALEHVRTEFGDIDVVVQSEDAEQVGRDLYLMVNEDEETGEFIAVISDNDLTK